jgi:hypothetical protein
MITSVCAPDLDPSATGELMQAPPAPGGTSVVTSSTQAGIKLYETNVLHGVL